MRRSTSLLLAASLALGVGFSVFKFSAATAFTGPFSGSGQSGVSTTTSTTADKDVYGNTFVASASAADGGPAKYSFIANHDSCMWLGSDDGVTLCSANNELTVGSTIHLQTTFIAQAACPSGASCTWYADPGHWFGPAPSSDVSGCASGNEGGIRANSGTHRLTYCSGSEAQPVVVESLGAIHFPTYTTAALPSATTVGAGGVVYDSTAACLKVSDGRVWSACL